ncbi:uncharacterized protein LOC6548307 [Drosophila erecta]|uniref:TIL domain-containing protein n=1 Tax=Drosophila erecta TaxID=7220 RepID=B3NP81_DROER|nr:uncharacterized protein LOC6548307 [Drosophila erecta]EDV55720.1 uncharacterized protein Dere_GG22250 [Drosophila erecta]
MKLIILVVLFNQIILEIGAYDHKIAHRICSKNSFPDCYSYCSKGCKDNPAECIHLCEKGCGCIDGSIVRNNGGCRRIKSCGKDEDSLSAEEFVEAWWDPEKSNAGEQQEPTANGSDEGGSDAKEVQEIPNEVTPSGPLEDADSKPQADANTE